LSPLATFKYEVQMTIEASYPDYSASARVIPESTAAELLGISKATLRRMAERNEAPARLRISPRRIGYRLSDIHKWLSLRESSPSR
jgi:predicted DNA-binding transcriptional regulator AlpA